MKIQAFFQITAFNPIQDGGYRLVLGYWTLTKTTPQKKRFLWTNPYKIEAMITSFIGMLQLLNFGHMTASTISFESRYKILLMTS